ncbi:SAUR-like auxin-responsive protein [Dorcoceras hygrometricum]|uniref:SAUR-like auxin-responsive protein n=1 Tax=Dorcoceras hygrometricum TaxID=472368 RepID=A0A2Z7BW25_9LAMI|nr:SAUR-like auxin-responsive protein [Dorcoceras hygrometricum]
MVASHGPGSNPRGAAFEQEWKCEKLFVRSFLMKPVPCISPASVSPWVSFSCDSSSESPAGRNSAVDGARVKLRRFMEPATALDTTAFCLPAKDSADSYGYLESADQSWSLKENQQRRKLSSDANSAATQIQLRRKIQQRRLHLLHEASESSYDPADARLRKISCSRPSAKASYANSRFVLPDLTPDFHSWVPAFGGAAQNLYICFTRIKL